MFICKLPNVSKSIETPGGAGGDVYLKETQAFYRMAKLIKTNER